MKTDDEQTQTTPFFQSLSVKFSNRLASKAILN